MALYQKKLLWVARSIAIGLVAASSAQASAACISNNAEIGLLSRTARSVFGRSYVGSRGGTFQVRSSKNGDLYIHTSRGDYTGRVCEENGQLSVKAMGMRVSVRIQGSNQIILNGVMFKNSVYTAQ